jgi:hypothetical protein
MFCGNRGWKYCGSDTTIFGGIESETVGKLNVIEPAQLEFWESSEFGVFHKEIVELLILVG